jgi:hypothetical protein
MRFAPLLPLLLATACVAPPAPLPTTPTPVVAVEPPPPPPAVAWTREPGTPMRVEGAADVVLPYLFMRVEVLQPDSAEWLVRCAWCLGQPIGRVSPEALVWEAPAPRLAAALSLAEFALAVRTAASARDLEALRPVMAGDFVHSLAPTEGGVLGAVDAWQRTAFAQLDRMPFLMDRGIAAVGTSPVWAAPPAFATEPGYGDVRAGFRRGTGGWEWAFLVRSGQ